MIRIYLALQEFNDGRVMFRRWSPDAPTPPGGMYQAQSMDAHLWVQRMVYLCAKKNLVPPVKWQEPFVVPDAFMRSVKPFSVAEHESTPELDLMQDFRAAGFEAARFVQMPITDERG